MWKGDNMTKMPLSEMLIKELMAFGLTGNEAKVYLALLQLRKSNARAIGRLSNIPRQEIYRVLPRLEKLGMVEVIIGKPTKFLAIDPKVVLSELIESEQEVLSKRISELRVKRSILEKELKKVEGLSAGLVRPEPVRFALISGQHLVDEKIQEMLEDAASEVLWMVPKFEIKRAIFYDRDKMLRRCAQRKVKVKIITEMDEKNTEEINRLGRFCEIRHTPGVTSLITIVDDKELIIGSALYTGEDLTSGELVHKLWTNDSGHIKIMRVFFEKVWIDSTPVELASTR